MRIENNILIPELARLLSQGREVRFTPSGVSMRPFIEGDKDSVILSPMDRMPKKGDIILAKISISGGQSKYVLHRLIRIEGNDTAEPRYILMGDGNIAGTETCTRADIIGRVTSIEYPSGKLKPLTRGTLWHFLLPCRRVLLKIYRHTTLKWLYC